VIVHQSNILAIEAHQKAGNSHAEVLALVSAYQKLSGKNIDFDPQDSLDSHQFLLSLPQIFFEECILYVTLEPCSHIGKTPSCASLLSSLNLKEIVIATKDPIIGHNNGASKLENVTIGVCEKEAKELLKPFLIWQIRAFVLFKLAQTSNAVIGGGYLSSQASLQNVHQMREVCDRLVIGGNTVRVDRPTLDCRFSNPNKAPNITIYSKQTAFDKEISLFKIANRKVEIREDLDFLTQPSFVLIEGGKGMLEALKSKIDFLLIYQTPKLSSHSLSYKVDVDLVFVHQRPLDKDLMLWCEVKKT